MHLAVAEAPSACPLLCTRGPGKNLRDEGGADPAPLCAHRVTDLALLVCTLPLLSPKFLLVLSWEHGLSKELSICPGVVHKGQTQGPRLKILWRIQGSQPEETPCELHRAVGAPSRQWVLGVGRAGGRHSDGGEERKGLETGKGRAEGRGREDMGGPAPARAGGLEVREKAA